jgi:hypothetical protein
MNVMEGGEMSVCKMAISHIRPRCTLNENLNFVDWMHEIIAKMSMLGQ